MTPMLCIIIWDLVSKRKSYIEEHYISRFANLPSIYECELAIRFEIEKYLLAKSEKNKEKKAHYRLIIIDLFHIFQKRFSYHKLPSIWEFIFFFNIIKEENLARLKLAQALKGNYDFEASYHYFKYIKVLVDFSTTYSEEVDYIRFKQLYDKAKLQDEDTCRLQLDFWTELSHERPNIPKLETLGEKLYAMIEKTNKACKKLYKRYPERALSLKLYGSFLMDVYNDTEKGNDLVSRGENLKWQTELKGFTGEKFSYFDENVGLLVVSGTPGSLGMVQYMSPEASEILGVPLKLGINMHICNFSPPPMNNIPYHNECIERYLSKTDYSEVPLPFSFFIIDTNSNLVEVYMQNRCVAIDSYPFFLVTLKRINKPRECLIYAEDFTIIAHTKDFATLIGHQEFKSLIALNLNVVIPRASEIYLAKSTDIFIEYTTSRGTVLYMKFQDLSVGSVIYRLLYITAEQAETKVNSNKLNPLTGFQELLQSRFKNSVSMKQDSVIPDQRGILKDTRFKAPKKDLKVTFNEEPYILIIEETDFEAGHNDPHKKDAAPIKKPRETGVEDEEFSISITYPEKTDMKSEIKPEPVIDTNLEILDLKDLMDLTIDNEGKSNGASSVAGMSVSESTVKRSSASVASSAVSSNASVSSSAAAQLLLSKVNGSMLKFKCTFLLTVVLVILAVLAMMIYIIVTVDHYNQTVLITEMSELRSNSVIISEYIRFLQLMNIGYIPVSQENSYRSLLINTTNSFSSLIQKLYDEKDQWTDSNQDLLMDPRIVTWNMYDLSYNMSTISLIDSLRNIARGSKIISATELSQITADNSNFYYIYRNGVGETLNQLNTTVFSFIEHEKENLDYILNIVLFLGISAITLMVICFLGVILPTIISVEQSNQNVWKFFYKLPLDVVQEMKFRCEERLETLHGIELEKKGTEHQKFKNIEKRELIKNSTKWPVIILKLSIYYIISAAFFVFFYFMVYEEFGKLLTFKPEIINWAGIRTMSMHRSLFWFIENSLKSTSDGIYNIIPTHSIIDDPINLMKQDFEAMQYAEDLLLQGRISNFGLTGEHEDLLFKDGCLTASCIYLKRGLHSALISMENDFIEYTNYESTYSDLSYILNQNQEIIDLLNKMVTLYEDEIDNMLDKSRGLMIGITVCYSATVLILYLFLYVPSINRVRLQVTQIWDNSRLIPIVLLDRIIRAWNKDGKKISF
jgi:hypothetical protein